MYAHYFQTKGKRVLVLTTTPEVHTKEVEFIVADKREARAIAKEYQAKPWNF